MVVFDIKNAVKAGIYIYISIIAINVAVNGAVKLVAHYWNTETE